MKKAILFAVIMSHSLLLIGCSTKTNEPAAKSQMQSAAESEGTTELMKYEYERYAAVPGRILFGHC